MTCLLVNISGLSGRTYDVQDHKFGLSKLFAATWTDIVRRQLVALLSPSGTLPRHSVLWIDMVKRRFIALFSPKANLCHPVP